VNDIKLRTQKITDIYKIINNEGEDTQNTQISQKRQKNNTLANKNMSPTSL
jgi:hypothetical protein